jgi:hypothetical protein
MTNLVTGLGYNNDVLIKKFTSIKNNKDNNPSFGSAGYIWGNNNKTLVFQPAQNGKNDSDLFEEYIAGLNKLRSQTPELIKKLVQKFMDQTSVTEAEVQTDKNELNIKPGTKFPGIEEKVISHILEQIAQYKVVNLNVGKENFDKVRTKLENLGLKVTSQDSNSGILTVQRQISANTLDVSLDKQKLWQDIISIEQNGQGNNESRAELINCILKDAENLTPGTLQTLDGLLKAAKIGIIPDRGSIPAKTKEILLESYVNASPEQKQHIYGTVKSLCQQLPSASSGGEITRIPNKGPIRHGILALKSATLRSDKWDEIGDRGVFIKAVHQLAHQRPAPELGYVCMAFAQYIRSNGDQKEFDRVLKANGVSFEDYFVKMGNEIKGNSDWNSISVDKPVKVPHFSDDQVRQAFERHGWLDRSKYNVDELMSRPEPKLATFFQIYGETIVNTLKGMGIELTTKSDNLDEILDKNTFEKLNTVIKLQKEAFDNNQVDDTTKFKRLLPELLFKTTELRTNLSAEIHNSTDVKKLQALIELDNKLEGIVSTVSMNMLSKAPVENGFYKLNETTEKLFLALVDNYALTNTEKAEELAMIRKNLKEAFTADDKTSIEGSERTLVTLNQLQRLIADKSYAISSIYKPVAANLAKINMYDSSASKSVEQLADGVLRGSLLFDISQLTTGFRTQVRKIAGTTSWQTISTGKESGRIIHAKSMDHLEKMIKKERDAGNDISNLVCFVDSLIGAEEPPGGVKAIITPKVIDTLAHLGVRCRQESIVFACLDDPQLYKTLVAQYDKNDSYAEIKVTDGNVMLKEIAKNDVYAEDIRSDKANKPDVKVVLPAASRDFKTAVLPIDEIKFNTSGPKAYNVSKLANIVPVPESLSIPFSVFDRVLNDPINSKLLEEYNNNLLIIAEKEKVNDLSVVNELKKQQKLVEQLQFPPEILQDIKRALEETVPADTKFIITRSSTNGEDLKDFSGAGLYESFPGATKEKIDLYIKKVWASKWGKRAYDARVKANIPHSDLAVSVLVQSCIDAKYAFVTHTTNPLTHNPDEIYIDLVQGLGEALVSGEIPGMGYSFTYNKKTGEVKRNHLADKTYKLVPDGKGSLIKALTEYKNDIFAGQKPQWEDFIRQIGEYSLKIENLYDGKPQDIEGVIKESNDHIYIVQTRDQLGIKSADKSQPSFGSVSKKLNLLI